jgi:glycerol-3-phosphate O-acyltransferase
VSGPPPSSGLFGAEPRPLVLRDLLDRARDRLDALSDGALVEVLEDALFHERRRLDRAEAKPGEVERLDAVARAIVRGGRADRQTAALSLVSAWADEIHGRFDPEVYRFATRVLPRGLTALLSSPSKGLLRGKLSPESRIRVEGEIAWVRELAGEATVILAPTHVSNMDSPIIGYALYAAGLPPFVYGAGLNLFSNPVIGWWMHRLGAYTVDRTKQARLYKDVLKDYSVRALVTRHHSLFFPGGTRARSGALESHLKKGLLGTGIVAWQEMLEQGRAETEVYVVPCTLSYQLVLEAGSLIEDFLAESGRQRFIITDDEFAQPRRMAEFARRVLDLDAAVVVRFGAPLDCLGNPVAREKADREKQAIERRRYVCDPEGRVERDEQRDFVYTERLARSLTAAYRREAYVMSTHLAALAAWRCLAAAHGSADPFRILRVPAEGRHLPRERLLAELQALIARVEEGRAAGRWQADLPGSADATLAVALDRFARYHRTRALADHGATLVVEDPKLCFYYRNRGAFLEESA